jgi:hypothetical protein
MMNSAVTADNWSDTLQQTLLSQLLVIKTGEAPTALHTWVAHWLAAMSK